MAVRNEPRGRDGRNQELVAGAVAVDMKLPSHQRFSGIDGAENFAYKTPYLGNKIFLRGSYINFYRTDRFCGIWNGHFITQNCHKTVVILQFRDLSMEFVRDALRGHVLLRLCIVKVRGLVVFGSVP